MREILKVVIGSRLHGLASEDSDTDYRGIFVHDVMDIISPYRSIKNISFIEGKEDNTSYELRDFVKYATQGNPNILEILWSNKVVVTTDLADKIRSNRRLFLDSTRIYEAHKGYAANQFKKMNLFAPDARTPKFIVAFIRSMIQGIDLLNTGDFNPQVIRDKDLLLRVKYADPIQIKNDRELLSSIWVKFKELELELAEAYFSNKDKFKPDIDFIESILKEAYLGRDI